MKTKTLLTGLLLLIIATASYGQKNVGTVEFLTNPDCHSCKEKIETELVYTKGVKDAVLDMDTKIVTVRYKKSKITEKEIEKIIVDLGYTAALVHNKKNCKKERSCE